MERQCGEQAENTFRNLFCHLSIGVTLSDRCVGKGVDSAADTFKLSLAMEAEKLLAWDTDLVDVARSDETMPADEADCLLGVFHVSPPLLNTFLLSHK